jgi:Nucleotidyltransferase domain
MAFAIEIEGATYRQLMEGSRDRLAEVQGVVAVALGGSRAQGTEQPDSDWDFGLYYEDTIDPDEIRALGYPGTVVAPGEWAYPMNGGAWLSIVRRWTEEAEQGRWELYRMPGYLCGMPSYALVAELALAGCSSEACPGPSSPNAFGDRAGWLAVGGGLRPSARRRPYSSRRCRGLSREVVVRDLGRSTCAIVRTSQVGHEREAPRVAS